MPKSIVKKITKKDVSIGSVWDTVPETNSCVTVVGHCKITGKVIISRDNDNSRITKAKLERFNGRSGGYTRAK